MRHNQPVAVAGVVVAAVIGGSWMVSRAGDLQPPNGPIAPTMSTLEQIYARVDQLGAAQNGEWLCKTVRLDSLPPEPQAVPVLAGSGVLHSFYLTGWTSVKITDDSVAGLPNPEHLLIAVQSPGPFTEPSAAGTLDARFSRGIQLSKWNGSSGEAYITLLYRLDNSTEMSEQQPRRE